MREIETIEAERKYCHEKCTSLREVHHTMCGRAVSRFGDYLCVDCAHLPRVGRHNQVTDTKFTTPNTKISKSSPGAAIILGVNGVPISPLI